MADREEIIKLDADLGNTPQQASKLKSLFEDAATGIDKFLSAIPRLDSDSKRLEVIFTGITKSFEEVTRVLSIGPRGGQVQGLKELTEGSKDLATGFNVLLPIINRFDSQLGQLNTNVLSLQQVIAASSQSQIQAAQEADAAEARISSNRRERNRQAKKDVEDFLRVQNLATISPTASASEIGSAQAAKEKITKAVTETSRFPGLTRDKALEEGLKAAQNNSVELTGSLGKLQQAFLALIEARSRFGEADARIAAQIQTNIDRETRARQRQADIEVARIQQESSARASAQSREQNLLASKVIGTQLREQFIPKQDIPLDLFLRFETSIRRVEQSVASGRNNFQALITTVGELASTGVSTFEGIDAKTAGWLRSLLLTDKAVAKLGQSPQLAPLAERIRVATEQVDRFQSTFSKPIELLGLPTTRIDTLISRLGVLTRESGITESRLNQLFNASQVPGGLAAGLVGDLTKPELQIVNLALRIQDLSNKTVDGSLKAKAAQDTYNQSVILANQVAQQLTASFSAPIKTLGLPTTEIDNVIGKLAILTRDSGVSKQRLIELFNLSKTPGGLANIIGDLSKPELQVVSLAQKLRTLFQTEIQGANDAAQAQLQLNARIASATPIIDGLIRNLLAVNSKVNFASVQGGVNRLFEDIKKGNLDVIKLIDAIKALGGVSGIAKNAAGGGGITPPPKILLPGGGGEEQAALLQLINLFKQTNDAGNQAAKSIVLNWSTVIRVFQIQTLHTAIGQFLNELRQSVTTAEQFQIKISEIRTLSQENQLTTTQWSAGLRELSDSFGLPILDVTKAAYDAISNQVTRGAQTFEFLRTTLEFAKITVSSATDAQNLLSSAIKSFGEENLTAQKAAESLFKLIDLGRVTASELGNIYGRVAQLAGQAGIKIDELGAALSTLTVQGIKPNEAFTLLNNVILKLLKPTKEMSDLLLKLGFPSGEAALKTGGLVTVFRALNKELESGGLARIADLESNIRAIRGAVALSGDDPLRDFESNLEKFKTQSIEFSKAGDIIRESAGRQLEIQVNQIKNIAQFDFGQNVIKSVLNLAEPFGGLANIVKIATELIGGFLNTITSLITPLAEASGSILNLFPGGALSAVKAFISGLVSFYVAQRIVNITLTLSSAAITAYKLGLQEAALTTVFGTVQERANAAAKAANLIATQGSTAASRVRTIALGAETAASTALSIATNIAAAGVGLFVFAYISAKQASEGFRDALEKNIDVSERLRKENEITAIEKRRQASIDLFSDRNEKILKGFNLQLQESIKNSVALLDDLNKISATDLGVLEQQIRAVFREFDKKNTPFEQLKKILDDIDKSQKHVIDIQIKADTKAFEQSLNSVDVLNQVNIIADKVNQLRAVIAQKIEIGRPEDFQEAIKTFEELNKIVEKYVDQLNGAIKSQQKLVADLRVKGETKAFEQSLSGKSFADQTQLTFTRVDQLRKQAFDLFRKGELEEARGKFDEIDKLLGNISSKQKSFREKAGKLGFTTETPLLTDQKQRQNEADRLALEQKRLVDLNNQRRNFVDQEQAGTQGLINTEERFIGTQKNRIQNAIDAEKRIQDLKQISIDKLAAEENIKRQFGDAELRRKDAEVKSIAVTDDIIKTTKDTLDDLNKSWAFFSGGKTKIASEVAVKDLEDIQKAFVNVKLDPNQTNVKIFLQQLAVVKGSLEEVARKQSIPTFPLISGEADPKNDKVLRDKLEGIQAFYDAQRKRLQEILDLRTQQVQAEKDIADAQAGQRGLESKFPLAPGEAPGIKPLEDFNTKLQTQLGVLTQSFDKLIKIMSNLPGGPIDIPRRVLGGPIGSDTGLFWGDPEEVVMTTNASRRFSTQLRAMNMGFEPKVNSTSNSNSINVGDIHVNVQGGQSTTATARQIGEQLRREIRRGTLRL